MRAAGFGCGAEGREVIETRDCDVLEYLDHNGGTVPVADLQRRGAPVSLIRELEIRELVTCDDVRVHLTDAGAAQLSGPPPSEPPAIASAPESVAEQTAGAEVTGGDSQTSAGSEDRTWRTAVPARPCEHCGEAFHPHPATPHQRFCSPPCRKANKNSTQEESMPTQTMEEYGAARTNGGGSTKERILALLAEHPDGLRPGKVAELLGINLAAARQALVAADRAGDLDKVPLGSNPRAGVLYFIAGEAKIPPPPDLKATTKPKPPAKRRRSSSPARVEASKPPPSDPGDLDRYIGALGRLAMIEAPPTEVIERLERVLELDAKVRGADG